MIIAADDTNGVYILDDFENTRKYEVINEFDFYESLESMNNPIISNIKSLRELIKIHTEYGIKR